MSFEIDRLSERLLISCRSDTDKKVDLVQDFAERLGGTPDVRLDELFEHRIFLIPPHSCPRAPLTP